MPQNDCGHYTGYVDPNFPNPLGPDDACIIIYGYTPSLVLGVLGLVLFSIAAAAHTFMVFRYRTWYFSMMCFGTLMEVVGYVMRILSSQKDPYLVTYFVVQYFFIVVAPVFFSASIYVILTKMISDVGKQFAPLKPKLILWIFICADVVATVVQITGAALIGTAYSNNKDPNTPNHILLGGLAFQVCSFAVFVVCLSMFLFKSRKATTSSFKLFSAAVVIATLAVYLRTCFRLAETAEGLLHFLSTHEVFFGCLEFLPIVVAVYLFLYFHPGRWLGPAASKGEQTHAMSAI